MSSLTYKMVAAATTVATLLAPVSAFASPTNAFNAGDLIKASGPTVYYFASNGRRYVFPNDKTYFTWYKDFSTVKIVSDGQLATMPLGGNVTYRPGRKMVKITTDPKVYVVDQGGILRHVASEQLALTLYGISWKNQIDDVPDAFFTNYKVGTPVAVAADYQPSNIMTLTTTITQDKQLDETKITVSIGSVSNGFVPTSVTIKKGTQVTWTNTDIAPHTITEGFYCNPNGICPTIAPLWESKWVQPGQTYTRTFSTAGSFNYYCNIHPSMKGTIHVVN